jgi:hypothetical protein
VTRADPGLLCPPERDSLRQHCAVLSERSATMRTQPLGDGWALLLSEVLALPTKSGHRDTMAVDGLRYAEPPW